MDLNQMLQKIQESTDAELQASKEYYAELPEEDDAKQPEKPVDIYQRDAAARLEESKKRRPRGSSARVIAVTNKVIDGDGSIGLAKRYDEAEDMVEELVDQGERARADIARKQYMEDVFIPAIETVIRFTTPDEVLNCKEALSALDKYALGAGSMKGYSASYIRQAYGDLLGKDIEDKFGASDPFVHEAIMRIKSLVFMDNIRSAVGLAKQTKERVDKGEHMASEDDYSLLSRVANF